MFGGRTSYKTADGCKNGALLIGKKSNHGVQKDTLDPKAVLLGLRGMLSVLVFWCTSMPDQLQVQKHLKVLDCVDRSDCV